MFPGKCYIVYLVKIAIVLFFGVCRMALVFAAEQAETKVFPIGELFEPLIAAPKEPQFSTGFHRVNSSGQLGRFTAAVVSYGEHFGLNRWQLAKEQKFQLSIVGAVFAQFNIDAESKDLINADYTIGVSATYRHNPLSYRLRVFHQSSHLGDELLLGNSAPDRVNLSLEAMDFLVGYEMQGFRFYGGGIYLVSIEPSNIDRFGVQFGVDFITSRYSLFSGKLVGGIDFEAHENDDWSINTALKCGLEYGKTGSGHRRMRFMIELYDGQSPFGQFYNVDVSSYGMSVYLLF